MVIHLGVGGCERLQFHTPNNYALFGTLTCLGINGFLHGNLSTVAGDPKFLCHILAWRNLIEGATWSLEDCPV